MVDVAAVDETFKRLQSHKGVIGIVVINSDGIAIRTTFDNDLTVQYAALASHFTVKARGAVKKLDAENDLKFVRIRSKKHEIMIAPEFEKSHEYYLVVVQARRPPSSCTRGGRGCMRVCARMHGVRACMHAWACNTAVGLAWGEGGRAICTPRLGAATACLYPHPQRPCAGTPLRHTRTVLRLSTALNSCVCMHVQDPSAE